MTWENLTADADSLRQRLGFDRWAVLGHSFGGHVALEYALRYPQHLSHLILLDTGGDTNWSRVSGPRMLARRGYSPQTVRLAQRSKMRPEALIFACVHLALGWSVMDWLHELTTPTLVIVGRDDFLFPPEHQKQLAEGIPGARLHIVEHAGHNAHEEQPAEMVAAVAGFVHETRATEPLP